MSDTPQAPVDKEAQNWAMYCHLAALSGFIIPFGSIVGPLVVWLMKKDTMPLVDQHGKESLNFQITVMIALIVSAASMIVLIGFLLLPVALAVVSIWVIYRVVRGYLAFKDSQPLPVG